MCSQDVRLPTNHDLIADPDRLEQCGGVVQRGYLQGIKGGAGGHGGLQLVRPQAAILWEAVLWPQAGDFS